MKAFDEHPQPDRPCCRNALCDMYECKARRHRPKRKAIAASQLLITGKWVDARVGEATEPTDPTTDAVISQVQKSSATNTLKAIELVYAAFEESLDRIDYVLSWFTMSDRARFKVTLKGPGMTGGAIVLAAVCAWPAHAEIDPPRPAQSGPKDGVWAQATVVVPTRDGDVALQYGELGGNRIRYIAIQGERRVGHGFAIGATYVIGEIRQQGQDDPTLQLARLFANWTGPNNPVQFDGRLWGEVVWITPGTTTEQLRVRARATVTLPGRLPLEPRVFAANEVFLAAGKGFTRNRFSLGVRIRPTKRLGVDVAWQRSNDRGGASQDVLLVQTTFSLGSRR